MGKGKLFKVAVGAAAIGSVCYVFRDKIKASKAYQTLGVDEKVEKVKTTIKEKIPVPMKEDAERDYFTLSDDDQTGDTAAFDAADSETDASETEDAATSDITVANEESSASEVSARVDDLLSDIPQINIASEDMGLSDVSEDSDVLAEQDKLDI